ncbi:hypothetical protein OAI07_02220, partial [Akkermansiaceae bacterium]|nr:hypothetical protein [Akkermansiaceae bacterium]
MKFFNVIAIFSFSCLSAHAEDLLRLESFEQKKGWFAVAGGEVDPAKPTALILKKESGEILSNG